MTELPPGTFVLTEDKRRRFDSGPGATTLSCLRQAPCPVVVLPTVGDQVWTAVAGDDRPTTLV